MAFSSIAANKMRSFLTMLGIIIGITAVVALVSIVSGATSSITDELESLGADKLSVSVMGARGLPLKLDEVNALTAYDSIAAVSPTLSGSAAAKAGSVSQTASVTGVTPVYETTEDLAVETGRFLKSPDIDNNTAVCVLGPQIAEDLFNTADAAGNTLSLNGRGFLVVGVLEEAGGLLTGSSNNSVLIPFTLAQRMFQSTGVNSFTVVAAGGDQVEQAEDDVTKMLTDKFKDEDAFTVFNQSSMLESIDSITDTMAYMMGGIGGISLLVGGIGIMNIMLVSVAERTREIGIRKAIGANRRRILLQFLIEALALSVIGGLAGLGVSWVLLEALSAALEASYTISAGVAAVAVLFSVAIGLIFGINPANKAAKLPPIEALRTE
jgi:putative ABC transport system permease protein